jgi:hypothetical protein
MSGAGRAGKATGTNADFNGGASTAPTPLLAAPADVRSRTSALSQRSDHFSAEGTCERGLQGLPCSCGFAGMSLAQPVSDRPGRNA